MGLEWTIVKDYDYSSIKGQALLRHWRKTRTPNNASRTLLPGNMAYTNYVAVTPGVYDYNPVILIIRAGKKYVFGVNVNWLLPREKKKLLEFLIKREAHKNTRIQNIATFRAIKRFQFTRFAYRLYHRKEFAKPRLYKLTMFDIYQVLSHNVRYTKIKKKNI